MNSADREAAARRRLVRKEIAVLAACWIMTIPLWPIGIVWLVAIWIAERKAPRWCVRYCGFISTFAEKHEVRFP